MKPILLLAAFAAALTPLVTSADDQPAQPVPTGPPTASLVGSLPSTPPPLTLDNSDIQRLLDSAKQQQASAPAPVQPITIYNPDAFGNLASKWIAVITVFATALSTLVAYILSQVNAIKERVERQKATTAAQQQQINQVALAVQPPGAGVPLVSAPPTPPPPQAAKSSLPAAAVVALLFPSILLFGCLSTNTGDPAKDARNAKINAISISAGTLVAKAVIQGSVNAGLSALGQELNGQKVNLAYTAAAGLTGAAPAITEGTSDVWSAIQSATGGSTPQVSAAAQKAYDDAIAQLKEQQLGATKQAKATVVAAIAAGLNNGAAVATGNQAAVIPEVPTK